MKFSVPTYSQFLDVKKKTWQRKSCGVVALKMLLDYLRPALAPSVDDVIKLGIFYKAYLPGIGWSHRGLVRIAKHFGFNGKNFDWAENNLPLALQNLKRFLRYTPVLASIHKNLKPGAGGHLVVITGITKNFVFLNDPDSKKRREIARRYAIKIFLKGWKKRIVVIGVPRKLQKNKKLVRYN